MSSMASAPYLNDESLYIKGDEKKFNGPTNTQNIHPSNKVIVCMIYFVFALIIVSITWTSSLFTCMYIDK